MTDRANEMGSQMRVTERSGKRPFGPWVRKESLHETQEMLVTSSAC